jgi:uncharacterized protein (DUF433 family)
MKRQTDKMGRRRITERSSDRETPVSVRLSKSVLSPIRAKARASGKPISRVIKEMLESALRMQRFPGIVFVEGPTGRRAHLAGTGLDVWEVSRLLQEYETAAKLHESFPHLSPMAIQIAKAYADAYPEEISLFVEMNDQSPQELREKLPWLEIAPP